MPGTILRDGGLFLVIAALVLGLGWALVNSVCRRVPDLLAAQPFTRLFSYAATGLLALACGTALFVTRGQTVLLGPLLLVPFLLLAMARGGGKPLAMIPISRRDLLGVLLAAIACVSYFALRAADRPGAPLQIPNPDNVYYATMAAAMDHVGVETNRGLQVLLAPQLYPPTPYHYFDLWLLVGAHRIAALPYLETYQVLVPALLAFVLALGLWAAFEQAGPLTPGRQAFALACLAFTGLWNIAFSDIDLLRETRAFSGSVLGFPVVTKLLSLDLCLVTFAVIALRRDLVSAAIVLVPAIYLNVAGIGISAAAGVVLVVALLRRQRLAVVWPLAAALLIGVGYFVWFYRHHRGPAATAAPFGLTAGDVLRAFFSRTGLVLRAHIAGKSAIQMAFVYALPAGIAAGGVWHQRHRIPANARAIGAVLLTITVLALGAYLVAHPMSPDDSSQFLTAVAPRCLNLAVFLALALGTAGTRWFRAPQLAFLLYLVGANVAFRAGMPAPVASEQRSRGYVEEALATAPDSPIGAYVRDREQFVVGRVQSMNVVYPDGGLLLRGPRLWGAISIADLERPEQNDTPQMRELAETAIFRVFYERARAATPALTPAEAQLQFLRTYKIDWLIVEPRSHLPALLAPLVAKTVDDPISGERFVRLAL